MNTTFGMATFAAFIVGLASWFCYKRHATADCYDYLQVLGFDAWKPIDAIHQEMENILGGWLSREEVCAALARLEDEEMIIRSHRPKIHNDEIVHIPEFKRDWGDSGSRETAKAPRSGGSLRLQPA